MIQTSLSTVPRPLALFMFVLAILTAFDAQAQKSISFQANVYPDSDQTAFDIRVDDQQISTNELNAMLQPEGGVVLRVTSIHALLLAGPVVVPDSSDYAVILFGRLKRSGSISGFGAGTISAQGGATAQINLDPGLYVTLRQDEVLTLRSLVQSNQLARVLIHGHLVKD